MDLELRHLRTLCLLADTGSVTKAATALSTSQPALTTQLQRIEREVGGRLFHRGRSGVRPTELGEFVLVRARTVLLSMDDLLHDITARGASPSALRIGGVGPLTVELSARLPEIFPGVPVHVRTEYSPKLVTDLVRAGRLDLGTTIDYVDRDLTTDGPLAWAMLAVDPLHVALWADHPLAGETFIRLEDLAGCPWALTPPDGTGWPECFYLACQRAGFSPEVPYRLHDRSEIRDLVADRRAVAPCQSDFVTGRGVVVRQLENAPIQLRHLLVWRRDSVVHQAAERIARLTRTILERDVVRS
ncbi:MULTISPECIES: LysR family transcriptional regulator [Nocardiopsis]|jgi:DNA-binding transcriptional LysR family regulator|uniref:LysR family transcriptional regulator n=2 Tax=Nocardiopsis alba TaxID=53437 RepID=A0A7K2IM09_9ACTN|nr:MULTISPECIES: LysR family transcriptional regulator [Nocardiopsis]AFR09662.1 bacterial regulatory helix-turn-helix, lysR family protein [Nocardiopsis alba ATCC BAA-2165]MEC3895748.1 LysR family transcriptional regulator [Nocardiopsis sp. LDBS1602]MYR30906.1 LysR family transcriptional regulator [Nocardiopsis alba]